MLHIKIGYRENLGEIMTVYYKISMYNTNDYKLKKIDICNLINYVAASPSDKKDFEKDFMNICIKTGWLHLNVADSYSKPVKYNYERAKEVFGDKYLPDVLNKLTFIVADFLLRNEYISLRQLSERSGLIILGV